MTKEVIHGGDGWSGGGVSWTAGGSSKQAALGGVKQSGVDTVDYRRIIHSWCDVVGTHTPICSIRRLFTAVGALLACAYGGMVE